jgi:hypothetical protein
MTIIHEKLYQAPDLSHIHFSDSLHRSYRVVVTGNGSTELRVDSEV